MPRIVLFALLCASCAGPQDTAGRLAVPRPLVELDGLPSAQPIRPQLQVDVEPHRAVTGPLVVGTRGAGLNMAGSVHRIFLAMGIPAEVRCLARPADRPGQVVTQLEIAFPERLSPDQVREVRQMLRLFRPRVAVQ